VAKLSRWLGNRLALDGGAGRADRAVESTALVNGVRLHSVLEGDGPLVVLLHAWPKIWC
jgi:hypothetical protein